MKAFETRKVSTLIYLEKDTQERQWPLIVSAATYPEQVITQSEIPKLRKVYMNLHIWQYLCHRIYTEVAKSEYMSCIAILKYRKNMLIKCIIEK